MLPYFEVSHLASSSSFYAAVTQPLGLRYLPAADDASATHTLAFGTAPPPSPVFHVRGVGQQPPKLCRIVIAAPSAEAVNDFHACATRASPKSAAAIVTSASTSTSATDSQTVRATVADLDGNVMEVVYVPPPAYSSRYPGSTVRRTQSTQAEASRIMDWNYDVATQAPGPHIGLARPSGRFAGADEPYAALRRSVTSASSIIEPGPSPRENSRGISAAGVAGIIGAAAVGAAAGAALTYSMVKNDRSRAPRQEYDAPLFQRRSTFPDQFPDRGNRVVEVERTMEKIRYPGDYASLAERHAPPPTYLARYSQAGAPRRRELDDALEDDSRSRHSSRYRPSRAGTRTRSEAPSETRKPLLLTEGEHRSYVSSRPGPPPVRRSATYDMGEHESYVSARSHRTASTIRSPAAAAPVSMPRPSSRVTTATMKAADGPRRSSRAGTYISARNVPLPPSGVGSSHAHWDDDDDADSIAPSDSISCVGSRRSGRSYR